VNVKSNIKGRGKELEGAIRACVIIPTYNEKENITRIIESVFQTAENNMDNIELHLLVVDDTSPDGTGDIVREMQKSINNLHILVNGNKNGLGAAYIKGFSYAMRNINPDILIEMDADFSHDPKEIIVMIQKIREGYDFVIGSRYTEGGSIPQGWGIKRVLLSKGANLYTRTILGLWNVKDCSGGYRAIRASIIEKIPLEKLPVKGYGFQAAILYAAKNKDARITEIPIEFKDRENGNSKMGLSDITEWGLSLIRMRMSPEWR
jgi:dolichol-phosphate mannosyltransferase